MMKTSQIVLTALVGLSAAAGRVHADGDEVDVRSFEYVDVIETNDGSVWKGVIVEQQPNVHYKIASSDGSLHVIKAADVVKMSKQRNRDFRGGGFRPSGSNASATGGGVGATYDGGGSGLPAPFATTGMRLEPSFALVFPAGD